MKKALIALLFVLLFGINLVYADFNVAPNQTYKLRWEQGEGRVPDGYEVETNINSSSWAIIQETTLTELELSLSNLNDSAIYRVRAFVNIADGSKLYSLYSDESDLVTVVGSPGKPCGVILTLP